MRFIFLALLIAALPALGFGQVPVSSVAIAAGNTAQRPADPKMGETRWNTDCSCLETFTGVTWHQHTGGGSDDQILTWNGSTGELSIEAGNTVDLDGRYLQSEVDGSTTNELQTVDTFSLSDDLRISLSLEGDGEWANVLDMRETIEDHFGNSFLQNGPGMAWTYNDGDNELVLESDQFIDTFALVGSILRLSLENDKQAFKSVDLSGLGGGTDDQTLTWNGTTGELSIESGNTVDLDGRYLQSEVDGDVTNEGSLTVGAGTGTTSLIQSNTSGSTAVTLEASTGLSISETGSTITLTNTGDTNAGDDLTTATSFSGDVSGAYNNLQIGSGVVGSAEVDDNSLGAGDLAVNVVSSVDGVTNDGGNIDLVAGGIVTITPDDGANTITVSATEVDGSTTNELQVVDTLVLNGTTLGISLSNDGVAQKTVDLSSLGGGGGSPSVISPAQITADQDDYSPTGWADATLVRLSGDSGFRAIRGFAAGTDGEVKTLTNVGSYCLYLAPEHSGSTAANRIAFQEEVILWPGSSCQILYDGTTDRWRPMSSPSPKYNVPTRSKYYDEGLARASTAASADNALDIWGSIVPGVVNASSTEVFSSIDLNTGSTASGGCGVMYPHDLEGAYVTSSHIVLKTFIKTPSAASDGTNTYYYFARIADNPYSGFFNQNNTIGLRAGNGVTNASNWEAYSRSSGGTDTVVDTGVAFSANTNYELMVSLNKAGTEATYWIDGVVVARITTNLPSATTVGWSQQLEKQAGTSARSVKVYSFMGAAIAP